MNLFLVEQKLSCNKVSHIAYPQEITKLKQERKSMDHTRQDFSLSEYNLYFLALSENKNLI